MITFQVETWKQFYEDPGRAALWGEHYDEFLSVHENKLPFGPDVKAYAVLDSLGALSIMVARKRGKMVGFCISVIKRHMHYEATCAFEDAYYLTSSERKGWTGYKLIKASLLELKRRGCVRGYFMTKEFNSVAKMFARLGGVKMDTVWAFWLQEV